MGFDPAMNALLPSGDEGRRFYDQTRRTFGSDETILVALADENVFTATNLRRIESMSERLAAIRGVHHVVSLSTALDIRGQDGSIVIEPFAEEIPEDPAELASIRERVNESPVYRGNLASRDGRVASIVIYLMDLPEAEFMRRGIDRQIARIAEEEKGDATIWITGGAYVKAAMSRTLVSDLQRTIPIASALILLVSFIAFRNVVAALIPLVSVGIALSWVLALLTIMGRSLNVITAVIPPLILVVGFAYAVHVVSGYREMIRNGDEAGGTKRVRCSGR